MADLAVGTPVPHINIQVAVEIGKYRAVPEVAFERNTRRPGDIFKVTGACLNFKDFENLHQKPWLKAYPDRSVQNLTALFAEGSYSGAPGWAGVKAAHAGVYLDHAASGNPVEINGLDWWKRDGEVYIENWVFVDMIHLFRQMGVDLLDRLTQQAESLGSEIR